VVLDASAWGSMIWKETKEVGTTSRAYYFFIISLFSSKFGTHFYFIVGTGFGVSLPALQVHLHAHLFSLSIL